MTLLNRMLTLTVGLCAVAMAVMGLTATTALRSYLVNRADRTLTTAAPAVSAAIALPARLAVPGPGAGRARPGGEIVVELRGADGTTSGTAGTPLITRADLTDPRPQTVAGYRVLVVTDSNGVGLVATPMAPIDQTVHRLTVIVTVASVAVLILLTVVAWLLLRRQLRPLREIAAAATALADGDLDRRVPHRLSRPRTEVARLTTAVNGMLARIQSALAARELSELRMRQFVADASHELRTPVTSISGYLQLVRTGVVDLRQRPDVLGRLENEAARMGTLVSSLLYLARLDAGPPTRRVPVDLAVLINDAVADARAIAPDRPLTTSLPPACRLVADPDGLRQVLANLLGNVRAHTPPGTAAAVTLLLSPSAVRVEVTDDGPGFDEPAAARAFERFWRADASRPASGGTGLGLAIVAEVVRAHGGTVGITGSTVWFTLPAPPN
ncbi:cell wall metabolism sensor histidine kinase WalK [Actinoplanes sp. N902-109]|uniref:sensor histidine kinase n=1 Tax=Actinoplanes sp. (strain N902-109) TaxID=649831 RepID=UPI0003293960|nr:HAMP domain-containing sensor histidine kinase [Actinoplanes sp. N902-109]AGL18177.1 two-component system sensor kinase [Actinoplanes sp. N902-109]